MHCNVDQSFVLTQYFIVADRSTEATCAVSLERGIRCMVVNVFKALYMISHPSELAFYGDRCLISCVLWAFYIFPWQRVARISCVSVYWISAYNFNYVPIMMALINNFKLSSVMIKLAAKMLLQLKLTKVLLAIYRIHKSSL